MNKPLTRRSYAKINLFLHINGKREDGYHDIETLFALIGLYDVITAEKADEDRLVCTDDTVPTDGRNLIFKALDLYRDKCAIDDKFFIQLEKNIPHGAGLGGGSSNAAVFLKMAQDITDVHLSYEENAEILASIGSDTVYFLHNRPMIGLGRGEILKAAPELPKAGILLINPGVHVPTGQIYNDRNLTLTRCSDLSTMPHELGFCELLELMFNGMEKAVFSAYPVVRELAEEMQKLGGAKTMMSGSGSSVFSVFENDDTLNSAYNRALQLWPDYTVIKTYIINQEI